MVGQRTNLFFHLATHRTRAWVLIAAAVYFLVLPVEAHRPPIVPNLRTVPVEIPDLTTRTNNALIQTFNVGATNQLTSTTRSGTLTVAGFTSTNATTLTVNGSSSGVGKYNDNSFAKEGLSLTDGNNTFTVVAQDGAGRSATNSVSVNLPATVSFTYDPQGNMTSDGHRDFEYDDADQLTAVEVSGEWRSEFEYDGFGRRRVGREMVWNGSSFETVNETRYLYDGMLVVQERDANNVPRVSYTRGTDLSGGLSGAGGIGGLLARTDHTAAVGHQHALYHADGGGNVTALINQNEAVVAVYRYDPFGHTMAAAGPLADANPYRFSSKEFHDNSGLYYYGFRFYDPNLQRWLNRDPIGERGGVNLYGFVRNSPINRLDPFGLRDPDDPRFGGQGSSSDDEFANRWLPYCDQLDADEDGVVSAEEKAFSVEGKRYPTTSAIGDGLLFGIGTFGRSAAACLCKTPAAKGLVRAFDVGTADDLLARSVRGDRLDIHHVGQAHPLEQIIPGYNRATAPAIAVPRAQHSAIPTVRGPYTGTARDQLAKDIRDLRNYTDAPNSSLRELIDLNKQTYPNAFQR